ncbi:MAG TPA: hypothetical protein VLA09_09080, partial [Longimicrobiales bacterium]|nr:hypothetical protein [Longimicrobiales bacterium]
MDRWRVSLALSLAFVLPAPGWAQIEEIPTPQEFAERAEAAERAPLFQSDEPLELTLRTDIEFLRRERNDSVEVEGIVSFVDLDGSEVTRPVQVRARGNFRRRRDICNFPPLRLNFPRSQMEGTVFEGEDRLKLVTPCQDNRDDYQRYVFDEFLAYRVLNLLTPASYRVRLVHITYEDVNGDYDVRTKYGFLVEADERMAERNRAVFLEAPMMHPIMADGEQSVIQSVFNYMIGNTDWSAVQFHNAVVMRTEDGRHLTVPYDFDHAGVVDARYATVAPQIADRIRNVRQRLFRGFCRPELEHGRIAAIFNAQRDAITRLYRSFPYYEDP